MPILRFFAVFLGLVCLAGCDVFPDKLANAYKVETARMIYLDEAYQTSAREESVSLPDDWLYTRPGRSGKVRYVLKVPEGAIIAAKQAKDNLAMTISRTSLSSRVMAGGTLLSALHSPEDRYWYTPVFVRIPWSSLAAANNTIEVDVNVYRLYRGGMGNVWFGPAAVLEPSYAWAYFWRIEASKISSVIALLVAGYVLVFWVGVRQYQEFGWYGLASLIWAIRHTNFYWSDPPLGYELYSTLTLGANWLSFAFVMMFALHFTRVKARWVRWLCLTYGVFPFVAMFTFGNTLFSILRFYGLVGVAIFVGVILALLQQWRISKDLEVKVVASMLIVYFFSLVLDLRMLVGSDFDGFYVSHFVMAFLSLVVTWLIARRQSTSRRTIDRLRHRLAERLRESQVAIEKSHFQQRQLEYDAATRSALSNERTRMMRDMHDGVGSQLVASLHALRSGGVSPNEASGILDELLDDLRIAIDALEPSTTELLAPLGNMRYRLLPRLRQAGIALEWEVDEATIDIRFAPETVLQALRLVQEAIANSIKHSQATIITLRLSKQTTPEGHAARIEIQDNGKGFDVQTQSQLGTGRGLQNMQHRAKDMGGRIAWASEPGRTLVSVQVPSLAN